MDAIGREFVQKRFQGTKASKESAHKKLISDIANNLGVLCTPNASTGAVTINLKDALAMIREHEEFLKGSEAQGQGVSPLAALREFLSKEDSVQ